MLLVYLSDFPNLNIKLNFNLKNLLKIKSQIFLLTAILGVMFIFQSCLKDDVTPVESFDLDNEALLINYFETNINYH